MKTCSTCRMEIHFKDGRDYDQERCTNCAGSGTGWICKDSLNREVAGVDFKITPSLYRGDREIIRFEREMRKRIRKGECCKAKLRKAIGGRVY